MNFKSHLIMLILTVLFLLTAILFYIFFTPDGSFLLVRGLLRYYLHSQISSQEVSGSLMAGMTIENGVFSEVKYLPKGTSLRFQKIFFQIKGLTFNELSVDVENGRIHLPQSEAILFDGNLSGGRFDLNVYSRYISLGEVFDLFSQKAMLSGINAALNSVDLYVRGQVSDLKIEGTVFVNRLIGDDFLLIDCPLEFSLDLRELPQNALLFGSVRAKKGAVQARRTRIMLKESVVRFKGNPREPELAVNAFSNIEGVKVAIELTGTLESPNLKLNSKPALPKPQLLAMLVTGKRWRGVEGAIEKGEVTPGIASDVIGYLFMGQESASMAQKLGLSEAEFIYSETERGVMLEKELTAGEVKYGIKQGEPEEGIREITQTVGAGINITDTISVQGEREIIQRRTISQEEPELLSEDKIIIEFKKDF